MKRINKIINNELYLSCVNKIFELEMDRIYCKHNIEHFMDVARIAYIINLEHNLCIDKRIIYAVALLHDIGRHEQYLNHISHEQAGSKISREILKQCNFEVEEIEVIIDAIASHRDKNKSEEWNLKSIIYKADKLSRPCFRCHAIATCNWEDFKKNMVISI